MKKISKTLITLITALLLLTGSDSSALAGNKGPVLKNQPDSGASAFMPPEKPPYPSNGAQVHVISIHSGSQTWMRPNTLPEQAVNLTVSEPNVMLLLFASNPIEWRINTANGIALKQVVAIGWDEQRVTLTGGGAPHVVIACTEGLKWQIGFDLPNGFPTQREANDLVDIANLSRALTGTVPHSYQGNDNAPREGFSISSQTARFALPARLASDPGGPVTTLRSRLRGSLTEAWSEHTYSAGRIYYEGTIRITGSSVVHHLTNIGLCIPGDHPWERTTVIRDSERKMYKDGDIFGIAADLEQNRLYYRVNGKWLTGVPGSGNGIPLEKDNEYRACLFAVNESKRPDTTWEVNFGDKPFSMAVPSGYISPRSTIKLQSPQ